MFSIQDIGQWYTKGGWNWLHFSFVRSFRSRAGKDALVYGTKRNSETMANERNPTE